MFPPLRSGSSVHRAGLNTKGGSSWEWGRAWSSLPAWTPESRSSWRSPMMDLRDRIAAEPVFENYKPSDGHAPAPGRLSRLARLLGVSGREAEIRRCFQLVCGDSLEPGAGWSSLNADGVPVQFALSLPNG